MLARQACGFRGLHAAWGPPPRDIRAFALNAGPPETLLPGSSGASAALVAGFFPRAERRVLI